MKPLAGPQFAALRVLIVEDELLVRMALAAELRVTGVNVIETGSADEAWDYLLAGGAADLIFSDICMPGSMNGLELAHRVKKQHPELGVILTSGSCCLDEEGVKFLAKPYDFDNAVRVILETLALKQSGAAYGAVIHG
ncbi:MAG: response regulator [Beijerinckiaceae bacterium]|nr:MAG: response regulator [Beijerinckiaceae bacterium]